MVGWLDGWMVGWLDGGMVCWSGGFGLQRQGEGAAFARLAFHADGAAVRLDGHFAEGQPQARAGRLAGARRAPAELLEQLRTIFRRDAGAFVAHENLHFIARAAPRA